MSNSKQPKLHTIGMVVKDMPRSIAFYRLLGLSIPNGEEFSPHVEFENENGYSIGFDTEEVVKERDPLWQNPTGSGRVNLQFELESPQAVDETYARLIASGAGVYAAPWDAFWGQRFARVTDPDGNVVSLFADLPSEGK